MYARYESHDDATLSYMEDALCRVHTFKDVFLLGRSGKEAMATANALRTELVRSERYMRKQMLKDGHRPRSGAK